MRGARRMLGIPTTRRRTMAFKRYADAQWNGDLQSGKGTMSTP